MCGNRWKKPSNREKKEEKGKENRYLFVTARFDDSLLEPAPEEPKPPPEDLKKAAKKLEKEHKKDELAKKVAEMEQTIAQLKQESEE